MSPIEIDPSTSDMDMVELIRELVSSNRQKDAALTRLIEEVADLRKAVNALDARLDPERPEQPPKWTTLEDAKMLQKSCQTKLQTRAKATQTVS